jgi:hypothetical protein
MQMRSVLSHSAQALLEGALIAALVVGLVAGTAFAGGKGGGGAGGGKHGGSGTTAGTFSYVMVTDANQDGLPNEGDQITYDVSKLTVQNPFITTTCIQDGVKVLTTYAGYYPDYLWTAAQTITLTTELWTAGAAKCTAVVSNTTSKLVVDVGA